MPNNFTTETFSTVYKDDFADSDNYHRILFNAGNALQARELTQMQTIIQKEIARFGSNIFRDGASVNPGGITVNNKYPFIKLDSTFNTLPADPTVLIGQTFTTTTVTPGIEFTVDHVIPGENGDPPTLYVVYNSTLTGSDSDLTAVQDVSVVVPDACEFEVPGVYQFKSASSNATGEGTRAYVNSGDFFTKEHFVKADTQSIMISKYSSFPDADLGFKIVEDVITIADDTALYDNQGATPNITSPGADRYRIRLILTTRDQVTNEDNFVYVAKIEAGLLVDEQQGFDKYNEIREILAQRTKEESGNYVARPFIVGINDLNDSNLQAEVSPGLAYINGYRIELPAQKLNIPKALDTETVTNQVAYPAYGNYVEGDGQDNKGSFEISSLQEVNLNNAADYGGNVIGTARVRAIEPSAISTKQKYYLIKVEMDAGENFRDVLSFGTSTDNYVNIVPNAFGVTELYETHKNYAIYALPRARTTFDAATNVVLTTQKSEAIVATASTYSFNLGGGDIATDQGSWLLAPEGQPYTSNYTVTLGGVPFGSQITIGGISAGNYTLIYYVQKGSPSARTKSLISTNQTFDYDNDKETNASTGAEFLTLTYPDIYKVTAIKETDANGADLSESFIVDNGARDNYYARGRLILKAGRTLDTGLSIYVEYSYFQHSSAGDFFDASSYSGALAYNRIPDYTTQNGIEVPLRDVLDFRSVENANGDFVGGDGRIQDIPQNNSPINSTRTYYNPRFDKLIVDTVLLERSINRGTLKLEQGASSSQPRLPSRPADTLDIYDIYLNAGTLHDSDLTLQQVRNKRYTMRDIARLEDKVDRIGRIASLGLLEVNTAILKTVDSDGNDRTKAGFFVDNLKDFSFSDILNEDYRASLDKDNDLITPRYYPHNVPLVYNSNDGRNEVVKHGDLITLPYTTETFAYQDLATTTINVNPFDVILNIGYMQLSPSSDNWIEVEWAPDAIIDKGARIKNVGTKTTERRDWGGLFGGIVGGLIAGAIIVATKGTGAKLVGSLLSKSVAGAVYSVPILGQQILSATVGEVIGSYVGGQILTEKGVTNSDIVTDDYIELVHKEDKLIRTTSIPYMRSVNVHFKVNSLRPNTRHWPFFDGVKVDDWCRPEASFKRVSERTDDGEPIAYENEYQNATEHPDGPAALYSDSAGTLKGSFFIPSTEAIKFRTGEKIFKLLDISVDSDNGALSSAAASFASAGTLETYEKQIEATRIIEVMTHVVETKAWYCFWDPIAQSFFVNKRTYPNGMFLTDVDIFFKTKSDSVPVSVQIREVVNGTPVEYPMPGAVKFVAAADVQVPSDLTEDDGLLGRIRNAPTNFEFDEPIYLLPNKEYAIVVLADTTDYEAYVAETYDFIIGTTSARISKQPYLGVFFQSQNGTTWSPDQTKDLMFRINKAVFETSASLYLENGDIPNKKLQNNPIETTSGSSIVHVYHLGHGFIKNDKVTISGVATSIAGIPLNSLNGTFDIINCDWSGYTIDTGTNAVNSIRSGGNDVIASQNVMINEIIPILENITPNSTSISPSIKFTTGAAWGTGRNTDVNDAYGETDYLPVSLENLNLLVEPYLVANLENEVENFSGNKTMSAKVDLATSDTNVSPIIDLERTSVVTVENSIDYQTEFNTPINLVAETEPDGGSSASKHITTVTEIQNSATGLHIIYSAAIPPFADIDLYYRTSTSDESITDKNWVYRPRTGSATQGTDNQETFREYQALIGGPGGFMPPFTKFQLKFVLKSSNSSFIPRLADIRAIALSV